MLIFPFRVCYKEPVEQRPAERGGRQTDGDDRQERMDERPLGALRPGDRATIGRLDGRGPSWAARGPLAALGRPGRDPAVRHAALAVTPNCGKTTLFNALTGLRQKVANYPGVAVG